MSTAQINHGKSAFHIIHKGLTLSVPFLFLLMNSFLAESQKYIGFQQENFFYREPSTRAESMGKSFVAHDGSLASIYYNPAGTATLKGVGFTANYSTPFYRADVARFGFISSGINIEKHLVFAASVRQVYYRYDRANGNPGSSLSTTHNVFTLNASSEPIENLLLGINVNALQTRYVSGTNIDFSVPVLFDFGVIKKFDIMNSSRVFHGLSFGGSIANFNYATSHIKADTINDKSILPVITRAGVRYQFDLKSLNRDSSNIITINLQGDYQYLLNSEYYSGVRTGAEIVLYELIALRGGWYNQKIMDYGNPDYNKSQIEVFTYGVGIRAPLHKFANIPLDIHLDYTNLPQVSLIHSPVDYNNINSITLRVNCILD